MVEKQWNSSDEVASWGSFLLDKLHIDLEVVQKPYEDILSCFTRSVNDKNRTEFEDLNKHSNYLQQRRVSVTPTLIVYSVA